MPSLCHIFEAIGPYSAIAKVAMRDVEIALAAGYQVSVVAKELDASLRPHVEWLPLTVPPKLFFVQWTTARHFIKSALGKRRFDVVHAHQPQVADLSDIFQCHFLTRAAYERKCLEERTDLRSRFVRLQQQGVLYAEDYYYKHWNPQTLMLYDSGLTRDEFHRIYRPCPREDVLVYDFPPLQLASDEERIAARQKWLGPTPPKYVLGFLGGIQERKGYKRILQALKGNPDVHVLIGGSYTDGFNPAELSGHCTSVGLVKETASFYAACDALIVPSLFEPLGLVAFEASARGTPVIATPEVGALPHLLEFSAGEKWLPNEPLAPLVQKIAMTRSSYLPGIRRMASDLSAANYGRRLLGYYDEVLATQKSPALQPA